MAICQLVGAIAVPRSVQQGEPQALPMLSHGNLSTCPELVSRPHDKAHWGNQQNFTSSLVYDQTKVTIIPNLNSLTVDGWAYGSMDFIREFAHEPNIKCYHDMTNCSNFKVPDTIHNTGALGQSATCIKNTDVGFIMGTGTQLLELEDWETLCNKKVEVGGVIAVDDVTYNKPSDKQEVKETDDATNEQEDNLHISAFSSLLQRCIKKRDLAEGRRLHLLIVISGLEYNSFLGGHLIRMFAFFERLSEAQQVFSKLLNPNVFSWSAIISAHGESGKTVEALKLYHEMRVSTVEPDGHVFVAVLKVCSTAEALEQARTVHGHIIESGLESDVYVGSTIIDMYSNCGSVVDAHAVFNRLPRRNVVTWSALIKGCSQQDYGEDALQLFEQMQQQGMDPDQVTFVCVLKACSSVTLKKAQQIHSHIIGRGFESDVWISNALVDLYARCQNAAAASIMFNRLPEQDVVACSALIAGYTQHNHGHQALQVYEQMQHGFIEPDVVIFVCILKACTSIAALEYGQQVHAHIIDDGFEANIAVASTLIDLYAKCGNLIDAQVVFLRLPNRNVVTWNALITGYSQQEYNEEVFQLFGQLQEEGMNPDLVTFSSVLKACSSTASLERGRQIYDKIVQTGLELDSFVGNALVEMYAKCGSFADAHMIFDRLPNRNVVTWSSLIGGYIQYDQGHEALHLFRKMQLEGAKPDPVAFACILKACSSTAELDQGRHFHGQIICGGWESDMFLGSILVDMYAKCGSLEDACVIFYKLGNRSVVTWNAMIAGYTQHDNAQEALKLLKQMQEEGVELNLVTFVCSLKACSTIAALEQGRQIHGHIIDRGCETDIIAGSTLINMYAKCGSLEDAHNVFDRLPKKNMVTWSALIAGYAQHCNYQLALQCFEGMQQAGFKPDGVAFLCLLSACSRNVDLVEMGCLHFKSMRDDHDILPKVEHYNSVLDLLGHAGWLNQAEDLLETIPCEENTVGWTSLLNSCKRHVSVDIGRRCFDQIVSMNFGNAAGYVLMSGIYAQAGMWEDARQIEELRRHANGWKKPAKAFIEIDQEVHSFIVGDKVHPRSSDVYAKLQTLNLQMKREGYQPCIESIFDAKSDEDKVTALCGHCEKLAIAFGLISTAQGTTIRVAKNLRMCADCHMAIKVISKMEMREIIITDTYCVHHFQDGECSCKGNYRQY